MNKIKNTYVKKILLTIVLVSVLFMLSSCAKEKMYNPGIYEGLGEGFHGTVKVEVTVDEYNLLEINIIEEYEMPEITQIVYDELPKQLIKSNGKNIDAVTGATETSRGLIEATLDGLEKAKLVNP